MSRENKEELFNFQYEYVTVQMRHSPREKAI